MNCTLCKKEIKNYHPDFNRLTIDDKTVLDICEDCEEKILKWQQEKIAKLFPTKAMKKIVSAQK